MAKTILVPVDVYEENAGAAALALAKEYADAHDSKIVLLAVRELMPGYIGAHLPADFEEKARSEFKNKLAAVADRGGLTGKAELVIREGAPASTILDVAGELSVDMIVIGSHDPGLADYFLGSVAARVVRHAHCSVLVVRDRAA